VPGVDGRLLAGADARGIQDCDRRERPSALLREISVESVTVSIVIAYVKIMLVAIRHVIFFRCRACAPMLRQRRE
jgi:hypothetical protein